MPVGGSQPGHRDAPAEGPPSVRAQAALSDDLRREIADARARFEEAGLRAEAHRLLGDEAGASAVLREQVQILADVQDRLGRAVSAAVIQRDAEQVLADVTRRDHTVRAAIAAPDAPRPEDQTGPSMLAGVTSLVAVLGIAAAAVLGLTRGLDEVAIDGVSADAVTEVATEGAAAPAPAPTRPVPAATTHGPDVVIGPALTPGAPVTPTTPVGAPGTTPPDQGTVDEGSPSPTPGPGLGTVVQDLIDAVAGLGSPEAPSEAPSEADVSVPDVDEDGDGVTPDETDSPSPTTSDDGFVPAPPAQ